MKNRIFVVLVISCILALSGAVYGQGMYIEKGQNGGLVSANYFNGDGFKGVSGDFGYCFGGTFGIGFSLNRSTIDDGDLSYTSFAPDVSAQVIKPTANSPIGISLMAGYESGSFSSDALDQLNWDMKASGFSIGAKAYVRLVGNSGVEFYPYIGIFHATSEIKIEDAFGNSETEDSDSNPVQFGGSILMNRSVVFGAGVSMSDGDSTFSAGAGLLF